jgi:hypothetical protein
MLVGSASILRFAIFSHAYKRIVQNSLIVFVGCKRVISRAGKGILENCLVTGEDLKQNEGRIEGTIITAEIEGTIIITARRPNVWPL